MEIIRVVCAGHFFPDTASKVGAPVAGRLAVFLSFPEIKIIPVFPLRIRQGFLKPFMLIGTVVYHQVHQDVHIPLLCLLQQFLHVRHGSENGINVVIIRDIVSLVHKGRPVDGGDPDNIHPQIFQVIQFFYNPPQIADAVPVGIVKAFGVNLIGNLAVPPFFFHFAVLLLGMALVQKRRHFSRDLL